jgi:predicted alpha/beta superfamily hydrolase
VKPFGSLSALGLLLPLFLFAACGDTGPKDDDTSSSSSMATSSSSSGSGSGGSGGSGGASSVTPLLDAILGELRADSKSALTKYAAKPGWPVPVEGGYLFASTDLKKPLVAGDHDGWMGTPMTADANFLWVVLPVPDGDHYRFTDKTTSLADPWARSFNYDAMNIEISLVKPKDAHIDRWIGIGDAKLKPRPLHIWVPAEPVARVLYVHDGQNLFDPKAPFGRWNLQMSALPGMLMVGIDNTSDRIPEYTHVQDVIDASGKPTGGLGDAYADFLKNTVRPLIKEQYGEPGPIGLMGSSLGGLISFHIADHHPGEYAFAASLSGTMGWGTIGAGVHNETMIERYKAHGHQKTVLYLDSGSSGTCPDTDGDGINNDDPLDQDNYCSTAQLRDTLLSVGYTQDTDLFYWHEPGAMHNEKAWGARVFRPLGIFNKL